MSDDARNPLTNFRTATIGRNPHLANGRNGRMWLRIVLIRLLVSVRTAESLADAVAAGTYKPSNADGCSVTWALDEDPQVVRLTEFTLFAEPGGHLHQDPRYLIVQPQVAGRTPRRQIDDFLDQYVRPTASRIAGDVPTADLPRSGTRRVDALRKSLQGLLSDSANLSATGAADLSTRILPRLDLRDNELRAAYGSWLASEEDRSVRRRLAAFGRFHPLPLRGELSASTDRLVDLLGDLIVPSAYQPFASSWAHIALCATFEQEWQLVGYTRGELLSSMTLAPGEQVTLEVHTWDKSSRKSEDELASESEIRTSEKMTQRDALTVSQELSKQRNTNMNINAVVPVPKMPVTFGANASSQTQRSLKRTEDRLRESTVEAASTLRLNRKTRVEVARETGREERQTRVVQNTNRCHTLNCYYFELVANYLVTTRLVSVRPCALLPNPRPTFTADWILCHQDILIAALLSPTFHDGFDAARLLLTADALAREAERRASAELERLGQDVAPQVAAIVAAWEAVLEAREVVVAAIDECGGGIFGAACILADTSRVDLERAVAYYALEPRGRAALDRLADDLRSGENAAAALRRFTMTIGPADLAPSITAIEGRLLDAGLPKLVVDILLKEPADARDDAGLASAIEAARSLLATVAAASQQRPEIPAREVAEAQVAFNQLRCHLDDNWLHYLEAVWMREDHGQRFLRLQRSGPITTLVENELLGFFAGKAAYPLRTVDRLQDAVALSDAIKDVPKLLAATPPKPTLISLPTPGTVLEAMTGQCDACEDFIESSRVIDLRMQDAKARQEEAEADRRRDRVLSGELSDPTPESQGLTIEVRTLQQGPSQPGP